MTKQIPEKTIEIWTSFSLVYHLGSGTRIWSWPTGADQIVSTADLRKWFMLELKAPEDAKSPYIIVDALRSAKCHRPAGRASEASLSRPHIAAEDACHVAMARCPEARSDTSGNEASQIVR
ncbi:MAG: hypothetical protein OXH38_05160, partial [Chloroflexi bacterium]|nr:hypothetical protein [Chloroflexota bacterium]